MTTSTHALDRVDLIAELEASRSRVTELEERVARMDEEARVLESEVARRGVKLSCARVALARGKLAFEESSAGLVLSGKMSALGQFAAGMAHELNTPAGAMVSAQDTLARACRKLRQVLADERVNRSVPAADRLLTTIEQANRTFEQGTARVDEVVTRLRAFTSLDEAELQFMDLRDGIRESLAMLEHELGDRISVSTDFGEIPPILCHRRAINQVSLNLLRNAIAAIEDTGQIFITTQSRGDRIRITLRDTGVGIEPERLEGLFDPVFTARDGRINAGMGLPICARVVADHGGEISVDSQPGKGTTFTVSLPTAQSGMQEQLRADPGSAR